MTFHRAIKALILVSLALLPGLACQQNEKDPLDQCLDHPREVMGTDTKPERLWPDAAAAPDVYTDAGVERADAWGSVPARCDGWWREFRDHPDVEPADWLPLPDTEFGKKLALHVELLSYLDKIPSRLVECTREWISANRLRAARTYWEAIRDGGGDYIFDWGLRYVKYRTSVPYVERVAMLPEGGPGWRDRELKVTSVLAAWAADYRWPEAFDALERILTDHDSLWLKYQAADPLHRTLGYSIDRIVELIGFADAEQEREFRARLRCRIW